MRNAQQHFEYLDTGLRFTDNPYVNGSTFIHEQNPYARVQMQQPAEVAPTYSHPDINAFTVAGGDLHKVFSLAAYHEHLAEQREITSGK